MPKYLRVFEPDRYCFLTVVPYFRRPILIKHIDLLRDAFRSSKEAHTYDLFAVVILPDHFHMLIKPETATDYPRIVSHIKRHFTRALPEDDKLAVSESRAKKRESGVWHRRYFEYTIRDDEDLYLHTGYIHYNPVKHKLVERAADWPYSSFDKFVKMGWYEKQWADFSSDLELD